MDTVHPPIVSVETIRGNTVHVFFWKKSGLIIKLQNLKLEIFGVLVASTIIVSVKGLLMQNN